MEDRLFNEIKLKFIPLKKVLKILDISRVTADTWHRQGLKTLGLFICALILTAIIFNEIIF